MFVSSLPTESQGYATVMGAPPYVQPMLVSSTYRITGLRYIYGCATLSAAYVFSQSTYRITGLRLHLWMRYLKCSLCFFLAPPSESLGYTTLMGAPR